MDRSAYDPHLSSVAEVFTYIFYKRVRIQDIKLRRYPRRCHVITREELQERNGIPDRTLYMSHAKRAKPISDMGASQNYDCQELSESGILIPTSAVAASRAKGTRQSGFASMTTAPMETPMLTCYSTSCS